MRKNSILISEFFKKEDFTPDEKTIVVEFVYGILRHLGMIDYIIEHATKAVITDPGPDALNSVRICTYQAIFTHISTAGIVNNAVAMSDSRVSGFLKRIVEAVLRNKDTIIFPDSL